MKKFILVFVLLLFTSVTYSKIKSKQKSKIRKAKIYNTEKKHITFFTAFCKKNGITAKVMPILTGKSRSLLVYLLNTPDLDNFHAAVKLVAAKYLLPLLRTLSKTKNREIGYISIFIYIRGRTKMLTSAIRPNDVIMYSAGQITKQQLYRRVIVRYVKP